MNAIGYFSVHGRMSDPGEHVALFNDMPHDIEALCRILQGAMIHANWLNRYGVELPGERFAELQLRHVSAMLARIVELDPRPLAEARPMDRRLLGNCRDLSLMLTSILRHQGVPARARCGFGRYFRAGHYEDHWVCEYWNGELQRWVLVDPQLDDVQRQVLGVKFDPTDVPRDQFLTAGEAWRMCRTGLADADRFGIFDMRGPWFIRGNLVRDVAALNKVELLPWDSWGLAEADDEGLSSADLSLLDRAANLTHGDVPRWDAVHQLYESDERLRVPAVIQSYTEAGVTEVRL
ncbi:MAG: transglutaminase-like domain-containing protein [Bacillota bacterium]|mgnify:CR=1 FL=1|jgi:hypothetical protein|nr:transglutaminase domain-containing protein [Bacillota bacterium]